MDFDHIVVGAGSSGATLAARLSEDPNLRVLLIEAGPDYEEIEDIPNDLSNAYAVSVSEHDWGYTASPVRGRTMPYARGKVVGGCSAVNGTIALRANPGDLDEWAAWGNDEWSWEKCLPYFNKMENDLDYPDADYHGTEGPMPMIRARDDELIPIQHAFRAAARELGYPESPDHNAPTATGIGPIPMNRRDGLRVSTAVAYVHPARGRENLTIRPNTMVRRVLFEGTRAVGVEVDGANGPEEIRGGAVTLSAGAVNSPTILLRSGIGPRDELEGLGVDVVLDHPGVGANLREHQQIAVALIPKEGAESTTSTPDVQLLIEYTAPDSDQFDDMQIYMVNKFGAERFPELKSFLGEDPPLLFAVMVVLNRANSTGKLTLTSADPNDQPDIFLNCFDDPDDMRRISDGIRRCWAIAQTPQMQELIQGVAVLTKETVDSDDELAKYIADNSATIWHPVGTVKMGPDSDDMAVLDQYCKVRGIDNLRVVDASVMPNIPSRNPALTCVMIAERVSEWIREGR